jgi:hypothetical protein
MSTGRPFPSVPSWPSRITLMWVAAGAGEAAARPPRAVPGRHHRTAAPCGYPARRAIRPGYTAFLPDRELGMLTPSGSEPGHRSGRQRLVPRPVLNAPLELVHRRRCSPGMPNDPYDLPNASALTGMGRRPFGRRQALAVSTAALTDHVRDSWHGGRSTCPRRQSSQAREATHAGEGSCTNARPPTPAGGREAA